MGFTEPIDNAQWYPHQGNPMASVDMTWWKLLENDCDIKLEQNNSFSGSTICTMSWNNTTDLTNSFVGRVSNLRKAGLFIIEGATNDNNAGSTLGNYVYSGFTDTQKRTFRGGTAYVIDYLQQKYPDAQIIFMLNNGLRDDINQSVETICAHYNVPLLKLQGLTKIEEHPDVAGMQNIRDQLEKFLCELNGVTYITEDENVTISADKADQTIMVTKPMRKGLWNSFCIPFNMSQEAINSTFGTGTEVQTIDTYTNGNITFKSVIDIQANKPYIVKPAYEIKRSFTLSGVNVLTSSADTINLGTCSIHGVYASIVSNKGISTKYSISPNGTIFNSVNQKQTFKPLSVMIECPDQINSFVINNYQMLSLPVINTDDKVFEPVTPNNLHLPATPIITADPYLSIWSQSDLLNEQDTKHISNNIHAIEGYIEVDGHLNRFMGAGNSSLETKIMGTTTTVSVAQQNSKTVSATQTYYNFTADNVSLDIAFSAPQVITDASSLDAAVNYISYKVTSTDGKTHNVKIHIAPAISLVQRANYGSTTRIIDDSEGIIFGKLGAATQNMTEGTEANWGYIYIMADKTRNQTMTLHPSYLIFSDDMGTTDNKAGYTLIGRDENNLAIGFGYARFPAPWTLRFHSFNEVMIDYAMNRESRLQACRDFDLKLYQDALYAGGYDYADLCQSTYRQVVAGCKRAVSDTGETLMYNIDANSSWNINQADQTFASAPLFLAYNPQLAYDLFESTPNYIKMFPWFSSPYGNAPHHLGLWPVMSGSNLDTGVDATTDMCILAGAAIKCGVSTDNISDDSYSYLKSLCNYLDLFSLQQYIANFPNEGSADNNGTTVRDYANLRIKCVIAMKMVADIAKSKGNTYDESRYSDMANRWEQTFRTNYAVGDHYKQGSDVAWGQKYPLFYDKAMGLNIFSDVISTELTYYDTKPLQDYGMPLDSRSTTYAKVYQNMLTAAMNLDNFNKYADPVVKYVKNATEHRPIADIYNCTTGEMVSGHSSVALGSVWAKVLINKQLGIVSAIQELGIEKTDNVNGCMYDLMGRKVTGPLSKGIYIINGKKIIK